MRAIGRIISAAPWCALSITACSLRGSSRLIAMIGLSLRLDDDLDDDNALGDADGPQVAVPALDGVLLGEAVAAEQLHAVQADLHALVGAEPLGQRGFAGEREALLGPRRAAPGDQPQPVEFDGDVGAHERDGLPMSDGLAEGFAFLHVRDDVVEHRVRRADRQRGPAQPGQRDRLGVVLAESVALASSPSRALSGTDTLSSSTWPSAAARMPMLGSALTVRPLARRLDDEQRRLAVQLGRDDEQFGVGRRREPAT